MSLKGLVEEYEASIKNNTPPQGIGSVSNSVVNAGTVDYLVNLVNRLSIKTISDCPCGLYENWINLVDIPNMGINYIGYDINGLAIERNKKKYPFLNFIEFNMYENILPVSDLIICRDCLFHFPDDFVIKTLNNFKKSNSTYLLATEQQWLKQNINLTQTELYNEWGYREINLEIEPFNMGNPIESHKEEIWNRSISLWKIN